MTNKEHNQKKSNVPLIFFCASIGALLGLLSYMKDWI